MKLSQLKRLPLSHKISLISGAVLVITLSVVIGGIEQADRFQTKSQAAIENCYKCQNGNIYISSKPHAANIACDNDSYILYMDCRSQGKTCSGSTIPIKGLYVACAIGSSPPPPP